MDHWGDPWADNANDKSPTKNVVTSTLPPAFTFAPVPLNGFVDDAGWGNNDDDGFGDWTTSSRVDTGNEALTKVDPAPAGDQASDSAQWGPTPQQPSSDALDVEWPEPASNTYQNLEHVDSEPSDSATVSQLDEAAETGTVDEPTSQAQLDVGSTRSSVSPSETSRNDLSAESPRTSVEDERGATKEKVSQDEVLASINELDTTIPGPSLATRLEEDEEEPQALESADKHVADTDGAMKPPPTPLNDTSEAYIKGRLVPKSDDLVPADVVRPAAHETAFACDEAALAELFPSSKDSGKDVDTYDDPIYSTSARKAWYRVTRKQTMREFNHGDNDDNYIRVTWTNSHVRAEVNKVVSRWAREDRISGTGPGARASFYWDTDAPAESKTPVSHLRTQSHAPPTKTTLPARQSLPPLVTDKPAAFDWSSPVSADPWKLEAPVQRATSTPLALKNPVVAKIQRQEGRAVSVDLTPRRTEQTTHKRTATVSHTVPETMVVANLISPPISQPPAEVTDPWTSTSGLATSSLATAEAAEPPIDDDDDDDWGEMVQTPTLPTPSQLDPFSHASFSTTTDIQPSLSIQPTRPEVTPAQAEPAESMFASPIVRLQSTISPTTARFKADSFVPLHAEQGPIGPGILKPANRNIRPSSEQNLKKEVLPPPSLDKVNGAFVVTEDDKHASIEKDHAWTASQPTSSDPKLENTGTATPIDTISTPIGQPTTPVKTTTDSWADADFSFFESALPITAQQSAAQMQDPSDPLSFFDTPTQKIAASPPKRSSRSPPRHSTPPPLQPLTSATSSVQRRKAEEDEAISNILSGLPDLSYMLR